jgi:hypothetical protein
MHGTFENFYAAIMAMPPGYRLSREDLDQAMKELDLTPGIVAPDFLLE